MGLGTQMAEQTSWRACLGPPPPRATTAMLGGRGCARAEDREVVLSPGLLTEYTWEAGRMSCSVGSAGALQFLAPPSRW